MGNGVSINAFDTAHVRIYVNVLQLKNPHLRVQMIQTCLAGPEYIQTAKRAGVYSFLLNYISTVQSGGAPPSLPGEQQLLAGQHQQTTTTQQQSQQSQQSQIPRSLMPSMSTNNMVVYPKPELHTKKQLQSQSQSQSQSQLTNYNEAVTSPWSQIIQTPKQKMVSYFSSCLEVLGIQEEVALTEETLKRAYKKTALTAHPDKGGSEERFEAITRAYAYLTEIIKRLQGGRTTASVVEAPTVLTSGRTQEAKAWEHAEPIRLNPNNLNMNVFNEMFEKTHMVDPDHDGYGDWLKDEMAEKESSTAQKFTGKFNRDVFNTMFDAEAKKQGSKKVGNQLIHPEAMAMTLAPTMGLEIGRERPDTFTTAPNSKQQFTDLKDAYSRETTISDKVANVRVETRNLDSYRASREKAPDPLNDQERGQLFAAEAQLKQREQQRQVRAANQGIAEQNYFERMKQLVITDRN